MSRLATCAVRSLFVLFAYCVASLAASLFLHLLLFGVLGLDLDQPPWAEMGGLPVSVLLITFIVAYFAFLPSIVLIFIAEIGGWAPGSTTVSPEQGRRRWWPPCSGVPAAMSARGLTSAAVLPPKRP